MTDREEFELYAKQNKRLAHVIEWYEEGECYTKLQVQTAYQAYQAATLAQQKKVEALEIQVLERAEKVADSARWTGTDVVLAIRALKEVK